MKNTLVLTREDVQSVLTMELAIPAVESAFAAHAQGKTLMPSKVYIELDEFDGDFRAMPSYLDGAAGVKWVNSHPRNPERYGLPSVLGVYILSDPATAMPLAIMDATLMTAIRTGAAAAVASKHLATERPESLGLVGCGVQAHVLLESHRIVFDGLEVLASDKDNERARHFAEEVGARVVSLEEASGANIVCTATPSRNPIIQRDWIQPGAHINAIGADAHGKQELDPAILGDARVFLDDWDQGMGSGEVNVPLAKGTFTKEQIEGTLGDVIVGKLRPRNGGEITVFDSTGLAIQDLALARLIYDSARAKKVGTELPFVGVG